ncbi:hypothetical protein MNV49_004139, partial [Pseudohyphozyma bogoriensis]
LTGVESTLPGDGPNVAPLAQAGALGFESGANAVQDYNNNIAHPYESAVWTVAADGGLSITWINSDGTDTSVIGLYDDYNYGCQCAPSLDNYNTFYGTSPSAVFYRIVPTAGAPAPIQSK